MTAGHPSMRIGLTYDLRSDYLAAGYGEEETAEFDRGETIDAIADALAELGHQPDRIGHVRQLVERLAGGPRWDLVFNICEGMHGLAREAQVPALLDAYGIAYTFSDPLVMSLSLHKGLTKAVLQEAGVPTARYATLENLQDCAGIDIPYPLFAKPVAEGTGKGITPTSIIRDAVQLQQVARELLDRFRQPVLVEQYLAGREFTVGLIGTGDDSRVLGTFEVLLRSTAEQGVYSYANKERSEEFVDYRLVAPSEDEEVREAEAIALKAWRALGCRDAGRIDIRSDSHGRPQFLEVNPLAGLHPTHSDLPMICSAVGMPFRELVDRIIRSAATRIGRYSAPRTLATGTGPRDAEPAENLASSATGFWWEANGLMGDASSTDSEARGVPSAYAARQPEPEADPSHPPRLLPGETAAPTAVSAGTRVARPDGLTVAVLYNDTEAEASADARDVLVQVECVADAVERLGHQWVKIPATLDLASVEQRLREYAPDVVFNLVESLGGNDRLAHLATSLLDALEIPYSGEQTAATFLSNNKLMAKERLRNAGLPTPGWYADHPGAAADTWESTASGARPSSFPATGLTFPGRFIIKRVHDHSSAGIDDAAVVQVASFAELQAIVRHASEQADRDCFAEQFIDGREFNVSLLAGPSGVDVLPCAEIDFTAFPPDKPRIVGYLAKWDPAAFEFGATPRTFEFPAADQSLLGRLRLLARQCWHLFGLRSYARVDFRVDDDSQPYILEINTNPCLSPDAGFAAALAQAGLRFDVAVQRILDAAVNSGRVRASRVSSGGTSSSGREGDRKLTRAEVVHLVHGR